MSTQPLNIVFLDRDTIAPHIRLRDPAFPHTLQVYDRTALADVSQRIQNADIVITNKVQLDAQAIAQANQLKLIAVAATGVDNIDIQACNQHQVSIANIRDYARHSVPEHAFSLIFALRRSITAYRESVRQGRWQQAQQFCYFDYPIEDLHASTIGIVGRGVLGKATAQIAQALGMRVLFAARKGQTNVTAPYTEFTQVLAESDVISLHCPLTPETQNLLSWNEFEQMQRRPLIINTARGGLVDNAALAKALERQQIAGAGIDVATPEPPSNNHLLMQLLRYPNFILTPHIGWASTQAMQTLADQLIDNIEAFVAGQPRHIVNPNS